MDDAQHNQPSEEKRDRHADGGIDRRKFLGALGVAAAAGAFLGRGEPLQGQSSVNWFYDSFGNVVPEAADAVAAGIDPPPLPEGVNPGSPSPLTSCGMTYVTQGYNQPNIVLIMVDQMRLPRWLTTSQRSTLFSNIMPNLYASSGFASNAVTFANYFVAATACTPSRSSLLTGLYSQQTCMFATQTFGASNAPSLQPYDNGNGFATIGDVLGQILPINCMATGGNSQPYNCAWIGKWHVSDLDFGADPTGANGPSDYGFTNPFSIPTSSSSTVYPNTYPSPNGMENEGTGGDNLNAGYPMFTYNVAAGDPGDVNARTLNIHPHNGYSQLSDAAIYHAFHNYWLNSAPASPWFLAVSFVGQHDIQSFPWAFGLSSNLNSQTCGTAPNDYGCSSAGPTDGFYPPPVSGWNDTWAPTTLSFNGLNLLYNTNGSSPPANWNNTESPKASPYFNAGGKPTMQAYFQHQIDVQAGTINTSHGWNTFLNYYYWLHGSVDTLIGKVLSDVGSKFSGHPPIIIFTSDHGDYGGSHSMHAKAGALYDESLNVPLMIHMRNQIGSIQRNFLCSAVDMLPFIYSQALGNESWRNNPNDIVSYLNNRESIYDAVMLNAADSRRLAPYTNYGGFGHAGSLLPYVLHTTDEWPTAQNPATGALVPSHAIAFRTLDDTVVYQDGNTGMNFSGGGKLGMYTSWLPCTTFPNAAATANAYAPEFEFYNYYPSGDNNYGELGNDAFNSGWAWNGATAGVYLNSYNNIMGRELYSIDPKFQLGFNTAFSAYMNFIGVANGGGMTCNTEVGPPSTIPWP